MTNSHFSTRIHHLRLSLLDTSSALVVNHYIHASPHVHSSPSHTLVQRRVVIALFGSHGPLLHDPALLKAQRDALEHHPDQDRLLDALQCPTQPLAKVDAWMY